MTDHPNKDNPQAPADYKERPRWLDEKKNVDLIWYGLIGICLLIGAADFLIEKHPYFDIENVPNFYGIYGFIGCVFLVLAAAQLRKILMRPENYYEKKDAIIEKKNFGDTGGDADAPNAPITGHIHYEAAKKGEGH
ncbi:MAG: hypothetical protein AAFW81_00870 [Pseudomonadota bacterium]